MSRAHVAAAPSHTNGSPRARRIAGTLLTFQTRPATESASALRAPCRTGEPKTRSSITIVDRPISNVKMTNDFYCDEVLSGRTPVKTVSETDNVLAFHHTRPF